MTSTRLAGRIDSVLAAALSSSSLPLELAKSAPSARPDLADRQCNAAIGLGRLSGRNPRMLQGKLLQRCLHMPSLPRCLLLGPPSSICVCRTSLFSKMTEAQAASPSLSIEKTGKLERILIDFGGPNVAARRRPRMAEGDARDRRVGPRALEAAARAI